MKYRIFFVVVALLYTSVPATHAYLTTKQESLVANDQTVLFLVEYKFGHEKYDVLMPVAAKSSKDPIKNTVSYTVIDEAGNPVKGSSYGIVLSRARYENGLYHTGKGLGRTFTLVVAFTPEMSSASHTYQLQVTHLPFNFDGTTPLQLNPSELQYYQTPLITLSNDSN